MQATARRIAALFTLSAITSCRTPKGPYLTGNSVSNTPGARQVDALWMIALPPVIVQAPRPEAARDTRQRRSVPHRESPSHRSQLAEMCESKTASMQLLDDSR